MAASACASPPTACQFRRTPHAVRDPIGSASEGPSGRVRMRRGTRGSWFHREGRRIMDPVR
eukprot:148162-Pyramimonas_sp.AAC.1